MMVDGNLCENAARPVQLMHQLDADAAARRDEFYPLESPAADQPEVAVDVAYWDLEEKVCRPVVDRTECPTPPPVGAFYLKTVDDVNPFGQPRAQEREFAHV